MILYFNKNGQLLEQLEYGAVARVGMTKFQIFAYFEGIDLSNYDSALIRFKRPDLNGNEYPDLFMVQASINYDENIEGSDYFDAADNPYIGYLFDFNTIIDGSGNVVLLDTPGQWEASITLVSTNGGFNVTGLVRFTVEGSVSEADDEETELQYSTISNNIALAVAQKISKQDENYMRYNANLGTNAAQGNLLASFYPVGCLVFDGNTNAIYIIDTVTPKDETHEYATISKVWQIDNPAVVDSALSDTSANPVENQVVTRALQNVREVAEGKCRTFIVSYNDTFASVKEDVIEHNKRVYDINGNDITQYVIDGMFDSDFDFICVNGAFNSQNDYVSLSSGNVLITRGLYPEFVTDEASDFYVYVINILESQNIKFNGGDVFLVVETEVPDRWYGNSHRAYKLETTKVDLTGFVKTDATTQTIDGKKTFSGVLECTSKFKLLGRFNHSLVPDGANMYSVGSQTEPLASVFTKTLRDGNNGTYGIKLPNTTGWAADKTLATTDQVTGVGYRHQIELSVTISSVQNSFRFNFISSSQTRIDDLDTLILNKAKFRENSMFLVSVSNPFVVGLISDISSEGPGDITVVYIVGGQSSTSSLTSNSATIVIGDTVTTL